MQVERLLDLLADGRFHSGQSLGDALGISRTAVWKQIKKLEQLGIQIDSVHGKGYRLKQSLNLLSAHKIRNELSETAKKQITDIEIYLSVDSTNTRANQFGKDRFVCLAEQQTAGRGRRGREWVSPFGQNIYLSLCWYFYSGVSQLEGLSLSIAVLLCRALEEFDLQDIKVKWPNDLLCKQRKLAGILLEMSGDADGVCKVVIGVGVNVNMDRLQYHIDQPWVSISELTDKIISRDKLAGKIINHLALGLLEFQEKGFSAFKDEWMKRDLFFEKSIKVVTASAEIEGIEKGVDDRGCLYIKTSEGVKRIHGGEISVRLI